MCVLQVLCGWLLALVSQLKEAGLDKFSNVRFEVQMLFKQYTKILSSKMYHMRSLADYIAVACIGRTGLAPLLTLEGHWIGAQEDTLTS